MVSEETPAPVQLGFSEPISDPCDLEAVAHNSPNWMEWDGGKIGGNPSWLNPRDIPQAPLRCSICALRNKDGKGTLLRFLTQIYSPADSDSGNSNAFHRSMYVFCCPDPICSSAENAHESVVVLRGQLSKINDFYPPKCDDEGESLGSWDKHKSASWKVNTCIVSGQRASGRCPLTQQYFCSKEHQREYYKAVKKAKKSSDPSKVDVTPFMYAESELVVEEEPMEVSSSCQDGGNGSNEGSHNEEEAANKINKSSMFADEHGNLSDKSDALLEQSDLNQMTGIDGTGTSDPFTMEFYTRIGRADGDVKSQCLRYCRWPDLNTKDSRDIDEDGEEVSNGPLWISHSHRPAMEKDIPPCQYCGAKRRFEFQVMPQMVSFLNECREGKHDDEKDGGKKPLSLTEEGKRALLAASDIADAVEAEDAESKLPQDFQEKQQDLVDQFKAKLMQDDKEGEALDFGTIVVYSCTASCGESDSVHTGDGSLGAYRKEFAWRQPPLGL